MTSSPPWRMVLAATMRTSWSRRPSDLSWERRGDVLVQVLSLGVAAWCAAPHPRVGLPQVVVCAVAVGLTWLLGTTTGCRSARSVTLGGMVLVNGVITAENPHPLQLGAWSAALLAAVVGHFTPHPDMVTPCPEPVDPRSVEGLADALIAECFPPDPVPPPVVAVQAETADLGAVGILLRKL